MNDFNFDDMNQPKFSINLDKIVEDSTLLAATRLLAVDITKNGYINVGEFFGKMSDNDLQKYLNMAEDIESEAAAEVLLVSELLAIGEGLDNGLDDIDVDIMQQRMSQLITFLACESLARKGLVKLHRENMSFGEDMGKKLLVEKL